MSAERSPKTNSILVHSSGVSELVKLHLVESYCYPVLLYALECFNLTSASINHLNVYWNSVYRKIFDFRPRESVEELICCLERMNFEHLYYQKKLCFVHNMLRSDNSIIVSVMKLFVNSKEFTKLCEFADVTPYDNIHYIRSQLHLKFNNLVYCVGLMCD